VKLDHSVAQAKATVVTLAIRDRAALYASYMPFLKNGGLFVSGKRELAIGDEVLLLLTLMDDASRYPLAAQVAWITPPGSIHSEGVGLHFPADESGLRLRCRIEELLGTSLASNRPTSTL
jgi:type IV pilus assembly protein PilZ